MNDRKILKLVKSTEFKDLISFAYYCFMGDKNKLSRKRKHKNEGGIKVYNKYMTIAKKFRELTEGK